MNHIKSIITSTATITISGVISWFGIMTVIKHYEDYSKMKEDIKYIKEELNYIKVRIEEHKKIFEEVGNTLEGVAYAIPYNNNREWQNKIVQNKIKKEMCKLHEESPSESDEEYPDSKQL